MFDKTGRRSKKKELAMDIKTAKRNLYRVLRKTGVRKEDISLDATFQKDLHFDKTDWIIFTFYLEKIFKVNVEDESLKKLHCVNDTLRLVQTNSGFVN